MLHFPYKALVKGTGLGELCSFCRKRNPGHAEGEPTAAGQCPAGCGGCCCCWSTPWARGSHVPVDLNTWSVFHLVASTASGQSEVALVCALYTFQKWKTLLSKCLVIISFKYSYYKLCLLENAIKGPHYLMWTLKCNSISTPLGFGCLGPLQTYNKGQSLLPKTFSLSDERRVRGN